MVLRPDALDRLREVVLPVEELVVLVEGNGDPPVEEVPLFSSSPCSSKTMDVAPRGSNLSMELKWEGVVSPVGEALFPFIAPRSFLDTPPVPSA